MAGYNCVAAAAADCSCADGSMHPESVVAEDVNFASVVDASVNLANLHLAKETGCWGGQKGWKESRVLMVWRESFVVIGALFFAGRWPRLCVKM